LSWLDQLLTLEFYAANFERLLVLVFAGGLLLLWISTMVGKGGDIIANGDPAEQFEYARSLFADGHLPTTPIRFPCGVAIIGAIGYAPAFLLGKALASVGVLKTSARLETGWSLGLQFAYCLPLLVLSFVGFLANASMLRRLNYADSIAKSSVLFWIVTTNVGYYVLKEPARSEGVTYALLSVYYWALLAWFWVAPSDSTAAVQIPVRTLLRRAAFLGIVLGAAGAIRQQNILHALSLPLLLWVQRGRVFGTDRRPIIRRTLLTLSVAALLSAILFIVPWIPWTYAVGHFRFMSYTEGHFNWTKPRPWLVLFVPGYHGLFVYHPVFLLAAVGLVPFLRTHRDLTAVWLLAIAAQLYLVSTWYWLSFAASIGHRGFFPMLPLLLVGFASAVEWARTRRRSRPFVGSMWLLAGANAVVTLLVLARVIDRTWGNPPNSGF
jgi:hypothetical protein